MLHKWIYKLNHFSEEIEFVIRYSLAVLLLFSGIGKLFSTISGTGLIEVLLPEELHIYSYIFNAIIAFTELVLGVSLLFIVNSSGRKSKRFHSFALLCIFTTFLVVSIVGMITDNGAECGCFGELGKSRFGWPMIFRNTGFWLLSFFYTFLVHKNYSNTGVEHD